MKKLTYKTVMALIGAVVLLIQNLGVRVDVEAVNAVATAIAGILVTLGIILPDKKEKTQVETVELEDTATEEKEE